MNHWTAWIALTLFGASYLFVVLEERTRLRKSVPMILAAGVLWSLVALSPAGDTAAEQLGESLLDYAQLFLFILSAVTYVNTLEERQVFDALRRALVRRGLTLRGVYWATGAIAFLMSPVADNLTTTLVLGSVALSVGAREPKYVVPACINIVVAANAGGAFSPFGDITTLMVWQSGKAEFTDFFRLLLPSLVNWLIPALAMSFAVPKRKPEVDTVVTSPLRPGSMVVLALFLATILGTVLLHQLLHLPPALGMMTGLGALQLYGYVLREGQRFQNRTAGTTTEMRAALDPDAPKSDGFDVFHLLAQVEWDTMMFFYGVMLCVGALHALGILDTAIGAMYGRWGATGANIAVGLGSAVFDNIPLMAAIIKTSPPMGNAQWLLATLATGVGGSLLSIGSAAGVALMGQAPGVYTFGAHLKWAWAVALGYIASVATHLILNGR